ncbi:zinc finger protein OZF-like isoform X1 [Poecilia latipinna]|uniref:zinc finger protein OZF-like isoform X1 n=1 Tax=Poecilia latipinna TaxID=48699 RepID=UPI00072D9990|nr:PREDICTED: zinc finger protein OZF-like isoform X1 [Poecilia latipinna]
MKVEADEPGGFRLDPPIPTASTSEQVEKQDSKDLKLTVQMLAIKAEVPHDGSSSFDQQDPEPHIKEEEEEQLISQEGKHLFVKREDEEKAQLSELHQIKTEDDLETEDPTSSSAEQIESEPDEEEFGGSEPDRIQDPGGVSQQSKITVQKKGIRPKLCSKRGRQIGVEAVDKPFGCIVCGKRFKRKTHIKLHMMIHSGKIEHSCDLCSKGFKEKTSLLTHMRLHTGERPFTCDDCGRRFHAKRILKTHLKVHSEEKPFFCDVCSSRFKMKETLKKHMRIHLEEKPFVCSVCSKGFSQQENLKSHMRVHTGEKPYICSVCSQGFSLHQTLKRHMCVHTGEKPFACSVCNKEFSRQNCLKIHMHVHTEEKLFSCNICSRGFSRQAYLRKHMNVHMARFGCDGCSKHFVKKIDLLQHMKLHTEKSPFGCDVRDTRFDRKCHLENDERN